MAFTPRTFVEILNDMVAYAQTRTALSDFTPGSVIRTIFEAAALEDDEQYFQMVQLLDMFSLNTATGSDLDRRMADFNLFRFPAKKAFGKVQFADNSVKTSQVAIDAVVGVLTITTVDSTPFPVVGFPYTIRVGESTSNVQDLDVIANNTLGGELTLDPTTPLVDNIFVGNTVTLVTGAVSRLIAAGQGVEAPSTAIAPTKRYSTQEPASIVAGNILSNIVRVQADNAGALGNTGTNTITKFTGGAPFTGATVLNTNTIEGGLEIQSDKDFREVGLNQLQSLSRGTPLAVKTASVGVTDSETGQRVESANIVEDFVNNIVSIYIDDGTGLDPDTAATGSSSLAVVLAGTESVVEVQDGSTFPSNGTLLIEDDVSGGVAELLSFKSRNNNKLTLSTGVSVLGPHGIGAIVNAVDVVSSSAEANQRRFKLQNFPIVVTSNHVFTKTPLGAWAVLTEGVDYILNHGTGELQIIDPLGLLVGTQLVAGYNYYTNLIALVQKILEGDPDDPVNFPGVKATGVFFRVLEPSPVHVSVKASITAADGFLENDLQAPVRRAIEDYINSRKIGEDVIVNKMIDVAFNIAGVRDIKITKPTSNQIILEDQISLAQDNLGNSLVVVV